jgi:hypothetical protein
MSNVAVSAEARPFPLPVLVRLAGIAALLGLEVLLALVLLRRLLAAEWAPIDNLPLVAVAALIGLWGAAAAWALHDTLRGAGPNRWAVASVATSGVLCLAVAIGATLWPYGLLAALAWLAGTAVGLRLIAQADLLRHFAETEFRLIQEERPRESPAARLAIRRLGGSLPKAGVADWTQRIVRGEAADGATEITGELAAWLEPGQRTEVFHLAICPPLFTAPEVELDLREAPPATFKLTHCEPFGLRIEVRLKRELADRTRVVLAVQVRQQPTATGLEYSPR